jgi:hypothetical protein
MIDACVSRPARFRPILLTVLGLTLLVLVWAGLEVYYAYSARPNPKVDYAPMLNAHAASVQGDGPDRWDDFVDVLESHQDISAVFIGEGGEYDRTVLQHWPHGPWLDPEPFLVDPKSDDFAEYLEDSQTNGVDAELVEKQMLQASKLYRGWLKDTFDLELWESIRGLRDTMRALPDYSQADSDGVLYFEETISSRSLNRTLLARMFLAKIDGDFVRFGQIFDAQMAVGWFIGVQPTLIHRLVSVSIQGWPMAEMARSADEGVLPDHVLRQALGSLERWRLPKRMYTIEGERFVVLDSLQKIYDQRGRRILGGKFAEPSIDFLDLTSEVPGALSNTRSLFLPRHSTMEHSVEEFFEELRLYADRPDWEQIEHFGIPSFAQMITGMESNDLSGSFGTIASMSHYVMMQMKEDGCRIAIGLALYRNTYGNLPDTLDKLVPSYLDSVPVDPLSRTGEPYVYRPEPWTRADGEPGGEYILYSVGFDGVDNGGLAPEGQMSGALSNEAEDVDYILNDPIWR